MGAIHFSIDTTLVALLQKELGIRTFVETGTFRGDTIAGLLPFFDSLHSVELSNEYYAAARDRFSGCPNVHLHHGGSPEALRKILSGAMAHPTLFWLDAHWCAAADTAGEKSQCPLLEELRAIGKPHENSVILIDDARYFLCAPPAPHEVADWPSFQEVLDVFANSGAAGTHRLTVINDVILFYPRGIHASITEFASKNGADWLQIASKAGTFDQLVATYATDWSQAASKAAKFDEASAQNEALQAEIAVLRQELAAARETLAQPRPQPR